MAERTLKSWGYEDLIYNGEYCCKLLVYSKPIASSLHYHERKHETFFISEGHFLVEKDGVTYELTEAMEIIIPPNTPHRVRCLQPGIIVECSTHDDPDDCVRLVPSEN